METAQKFVASIVNSEIPKFITNWLFSWQSIVIIIILILVAAIALVALAFKQF